MFKFSKKFLSLILAIIMLTMTAIGVNAHDELPAEEIDTISIVVDSEETEATNDSEQLEEVVSSVAEIITQPNEYEVVVEGKEEELQPQRASRSIVNCVQAIGYSGDSYSITIYQSGMVVASAGNYSINKAYNDSAMGYFNAVSAMQTYFLSMSPDEIRIWQAVKASSEINDLISQMLGLAPNNVVTDLANRLLDIMGNTYSIADATAWAYVYRDWYSAEQEALDAYNNFALS